MNMFRIRKFSLSGTLGVAAVALLFMCGPSLHAQKKPAAPAPKPAAKPAAKPSATGKTTTSTAGRGTTSTAGRGTTGTAGRGTTGRGTTSTAGRGATGRGGTTGGARGGTTAGRGGSPGGARGGSSFANKGGRGSTTVHTARGNDVRKDSHGNVRDVHTKSGMDIHHGPGGSRRSEMDHGRMNRTVAFRGGHGYSERPYRYGGHDYGHRTYYDHGRAYDRYYRGYGWHGGYFEGYSPAFYYSAGFYGWAYNPWVAPMPYAWGWGGAPWVGFYGAYFTPYASYPSASFWLTDYLVSQTLAAAYADQAAANANAQVAAEAAPPAPMTPDVKALIAAEVQRQIALENSEAKVAETGETDPASSGVVRMLTDNQSHMFVAGADLDLTDAAGNECSISQGDALQLIAPHAPLEGDALTAILVVMASKAQDCGKGSTVLVSVNDLQDMQNHMRETIDQGMGDLQAHKNGLPAPPPSATAPPVQAAFDKGAPGPDPQAAAEIQAQAQAADQADKDAIADASAQGGPSAAAAPAGPPISIGIGQTIDQVTGALGQPKSIVDLGAKKIYVYKDMKITFKDGKVTDVQ